MLKRIASTKSSETLFSLQERSLTPLTNGEKIAIASCVSVAVLTIIACFITYRQMTIAAQDFYNRITRKQTEDRRREIRDRSIELEREEEGKKQSNLIFFFT
jgi:hypothetical protein